MNKMEIIQLGHAGLRSRADNIAPDENYRELAECLHYCLSNTQGVGIAAPQINFAKRMIIVASKPSERYPHAPLMMPTMMINPSYRCLSTEQVKDWEGCLSIPGIRALVPRYTEIAICYYDEEYVLQQSILTGFIARVFQHEVDHLDGIVYLDRVQTSLDIISEQQYQQRIMM